jgi:hypothetical protein
MIQVNNYKEVSYSEFQNALDQAMAESVLTELEIAIKVGVKTTATIKNAFRKDAQIVSDEVLSKIMKTIKLNGFILWTNGQRYYYIN